MSEHSPFSTSPLASIADNWRFLGLKEILESPDLTEPPWRVRGLVAEGCGTLTSALPLACKSYTWLQAALEAPLQRTVWSHFDAAKVQRALYIETEDPEWMVRERVKALAKGLQIKPEHIPDAGGFVVAITGQFDLVRADYQLKTAIDKYKPDFVVLSTLQGLLAGRDWRDQAAMVQ